MPDVSKIIPAAAAAAQKVVANSQVPHNIIISPSVSVARKTPTFAGMTIGTRIQNSAGKSPKQSQTSATKVPLPFVPTQSYDGSTAKNSSYVPGKGNYSTNAALQDALIAKLKGLGK